ncbi:MAG: hypothetical protein Q4F57_04785 [Weeksellaceae bacterium]|nr:hypothetical protein [Weeksellaceae bacterium]
MSKIILKCILTAFPDFFYLGGSRSSCAGAGQAIELNLAHPCLQNCVCIGFQPVGGFNPLQFTFCKRHGFHKDTAHVLAAAWLRQAL